MCLSSGSNFQLGWEVDGGVGSKVLTHAKKFLNYFWRVTPDLPNILLQRLDPFTGLSRDELNFISIFGAGEIPWSRYTPNCAIIYLFVKYLNPLYLPPLLPAFAIIAFVFVQDWNSSIVTAFGCVFLVHDLGKKILNHSAGWESRLIFDGFSIGSNDLTQLVLGCDRDSAELAPLFDESDSAIKAAIKAAIEGAHRHGLPVGLCGQAPSDNPDFAAFLVEQGIDSISITPDSVLQVVGIVHDAEKKFSMKKDIRNALKEEKEAEGTIKPSVEV